MTEIWKRINGYESIYEVSNLGNVRSLDRFVLYKDGRMGFIKGKQLKPCISTRGYYFINLSRTGKARPFKIHNLVADSFLEKTKPQVNHKDGNKLNNNVNNLEFVTNSENQIHAVRNGKRNTKLSLEDVIFIKRNKRIENRALADRFNVDISLIRLIRNEKIWKHAQI